MVGDEGVYQCVGQVGQDESTAIVSSSYLNLQCEGESYIIDNSVIIIVSYR